MRLKDLQLGGYYQDICSDSYFKVHTIADSPSGSIVILGRGIRNKRYNSSWDFWNDAIEFKEMSYPQIKWLDDCIAQGRYLRYTTPDSKVPTKPHPREKKPRDNYLTFN